MTRCLPVAVALVLTLLTAPASAAEPPAQPELWVYAPINFQATQRVDELIALLERAKKAGYAAAVVTDYKFGKLDGDRPEHFWTNLRRTRDAAKRIGIELIPCVFPIGYSGSLLQNDPHLAEAISARGVRMIVRDGRATVADAENLLPGGGFEEGGGHAPRGWDFVDGFGTTSTLDRAVKRSGASALRMGEFRKGNEAGNARVARKVAVRPWHQYEITAWIRTAGIDNPGELHIKALAGGRSLQYANLGVKRDQDWTPHSVLINSLEHTELTVYVGLWSGAGGTFWLDDVQMTPVAGVNMIRRAGCPLRVTTADGRELAEGRDFEPWAHPHMGAVPWPGSYEATHAEPPLVLTDRAGVKDGEELRIDFWHTVTIYDGQVACCLLNDKVFELLRREAEVVQRELEPKRWFMQHDEIRVAGWCGTCAGKPGMDTCGKMLAENARRCVAILREVDPDGQVIVWSDMFDPHHNAVDRYYLCASTFAGAWEGLDRSVAIANWNGGHRADSLGFFARRGHPQVIAGYYDHPDVAGEIERWRAGAQAAGVRPTAWIYTTWRGDYSNLERFAESVR